MRTLVIEADVLDVALAVGAVVGFGCFVAVIVGALATSKIPTPLPTPTDYYIGRDDLGHEYLIAVESSADSATLPNSPAESADTSSVPLDQSPTGHAGDTRAADPAAEKGSAPNLRSVP